MSKTQIDAFPNVIFLKPTRVRIFKKGDRVKTKEGYKGRKFTDALIIKAHHNQREFHQKVLVYIDKHAYWITAKDIEISDTQKAVEEL